jgi:hypothetical protein
VAADPRQARRIGCIVVVVVVLLGAVAIGIAAFVLAEPMVRRYAIDEARERGFELEPGQIEFGLGWVDLFDSTVRPIGVRGVTTRVARIGIELSGFEAKSIDLKGVAVTVTGSAATLALELSEWTKRYPHAYQLPISAQGVDVHWSAGPGEAPWLIIAGGVVGRTLDGGVFTASNTTLSGINLGRVGASWTSQSSAVALGFGEEDPSKAPIRLRVEHAGKPPTAQLTLAPTKLDRLAGPLGVALPVEGVTASAEVNLILPPGFTAGKVSGTASIRLEGWVPPHPRELDGFVFGNVTTFDTKLEVNEDQSQVTLSESRVKAGAFAVTGGGLIERFEGYARIRMSLSGHLACVALAGAAAESYLGRTLGKLVGLAASHTMAGSVSVIVKLEADTRRLPEARILRTIGIGCGLKPLAIEFPELLRDLPSFLPSMPSGLPQLPSLPTELPRAPELPKFPFPTFGEQKPEESKQPSPP